MKKLNIQNILVPVDFSAMSALAIEAALGLAKRFAASVHFVHVHEYFYPVGFMAPGAPVPISMITFREDAARRVVHDLTTLARKYGISPANCYIQKEMPIFNEICKVAHAIRADLIVMPTHGRTGLKHVALGSTAERVVQHSPCPVLIVKGSSVGGAKRSGKMDKILVPVDFSRCSLQGLKYAIQVADRFAARISVLNAVYLGYAYTADGFAMYDLSALEKAAREIAEREMVRFVHAAKFGSVKFETAVTIGPPLDHICASAKNKDIDLIITSTHGYTGFKHVLIGSTAEQIVRRAPCSVLVVPSHPAVRATPLTGQTRKALRLIRVLAPRVTQRKTIASEQFTKKYRKGASHPAPERRQINKFRESHPVRR